MLIDTNSQLTLSATIASIDKTKVTLLLVETVDTCEGLPDLPPPNRIHEVMNPMQAQELIYRYMEKDRALYKAIPNAEQSGARDGREYMRAGDRKAKAIQELKAKYAAYGVSFTVGENTIGLF